MKLATRYAAIAALVVAISGPAALASRPVLMPVTGRVSEVRGEDTIVVDGKSYRILAGSPAAQAIGRVHAGQVVDLVFNGEPAQMSSRVIEINVH